MNGRVVVHPGGPGIQGAQVLLEKRIVTVTDKDGQYTLSNLKASTYSLQVIAGILLVHFKMKQ